MVILSSVRYLSSSSVLYSLLFTDLIFRKAKEQAITIINS